jgi:hypothetical protein
MKRSKFVKIFEDLTDSEVWDVYALSINTLKQRGLVRTRNIVGERGEFLAIEFYNKNSHLPNLQAAPEGTQNVDALSRKGDRYSIKTITQPGKTTSVFYNCGNYGDENYPEKKFEFVIIVIIGKDFQQKQIIEIDWKQFLKFRKWHKTMRAWNISITENLLKEANILY